MCEVISPQPEALWVLADILYQPLGTPRPTVSGACLQFAPCGSPFLCGTRGVTQLLQLGTLHPAKYRAGSVHAYHRQGNRGADGARRSTLVNQRPLNPRHRGGCWYSTSTSDNLFPGETPLWLLGPPALDPYFLCFLPPQACSGL